MLVSDQERVVLLQINFKDNKTDFTIGDVLWAGLTGVEAVGGVFIKPGVMVLNDMTSLLKFEAGVHWEDGHDEYPDIVMAHQGARVLNGMRTLADHHSLDKALCLLNSTHSVKR